MDIKQDGSKFSRIARTLPVCLRYMGTLGENLLAQLYGILYTTRW